MQSEALRNIRTMRQVRISLDVARNQKVRTTNSLSRTKGEIAHLQTAADPRLKELLGSEMKRFASQEASVEKSRRRVLKLRQKLAATINRNRTLTELRHELQQARWEGRDPVPSGRELRDVSKKLRRMNLRY